MLAAVSGNKPLKSGRLDRGRNPSDHERQKVESLTKCVKNRMLLANG